MSCFSRNYIWNTTLRVKSTPFQSNSASTQYVVQLNQNSTDQYQLLVNGKEIQHNLSWNMCSPLCCSGGDFGWEQDGHHFLLMYNSLAWLRFMQGFRLFVDGIDVETGLEFRAYWRRKGLQFLFPGLFLALVGVILTCVFEFVVVSRDKFFWIGFGLIFIGVVYVFMGLIPVLRKYNEPRYHYGTFMYEQNAGFDNSAPALKT